MTSDNCLECGRPRARTWEDMMNGYCPKYYAILDAEARADCEKVAQDKSKERVLYIKITDLEWRIQLIEERMRLQ